MKCHEVGLLMVLTLVVAVFEGRRAKVILPKVPDVLKPQVPSFSELIARLKTSFFRF
jgi:hypothetical protein